MLSPMMQHYLDTKKEYADCILFYRLGDFYEMFFEDAKLVSKELELFLTSKDCGLEERAPMCGVPFHAADSYINKLVEKGYKVAIAEQVEDPKLAKGLVKREVIRIVTPGTNMNPDALAYDKNHYIVSLYYDGNSYGLASCDITTGDFLATECRDLPQVYDELDKLSPAELVINRALSISGFNSDGSRNLSGIPITELPDIAYSEPGCTSLLTAQFKKEGLYDLKERPLALSASGGLLYYLSDTQKTSLAHITAVGIYDIGKYMVLDSFTRRNLELTETLRDKEKKGSLLYVLDRTKTAMGARELRLLIEQPLLIASDIIARSDAVSMLYDDIVLREEIREYLNPIRDLERLMARIAYGSVNPKEMVSFAASLRMLPDVKQQLAEIKTGLLHEIYEKLDTLSDICELISSTICDDPPLTVREGGIVREGYSEEVDRLRKARTEGKNWLAQLEQKERERTGIKTLKIKYSHVFGYCFEVSNTFKELVPDDYVRRQTLVNAERFTSEKLKEMEETILGAEDRLSNLEYDIFKMVRETVSDNVLRVKQTAKAIGYLDALASLAAVAASNGYVRPRINTSGVITIKGGRHPVVEEMLGSGSFVKNDTLLDSDANAISVITGPNMAGKSTYMRQCALIVLMAQIGSFVPADEADICVCDRIFTRVGASDDLASGQSTFMVEMNEVANILNNATSDSLLILDEIGRGTSTFDGLAIAWSVIEYIDSNIKAKTLFATHYHELTELEGKLHGVQNYCIAVKESGDDIVFLRKIMKGGADKSYGIQVAKLAGLPEAMLERAKEIVSMLNDADINQKTADIAANVQTDALTTSAKSSGVEKTLAGIDVERLTPLEALNLIYELKSELDK